MLKVISIVFFITINIAQISVFEIQGLFSDAHTTSLERHFEEKLYTEKDLFVIQYSAYDYTTGVTRQFNELFEELIDQNNFPRAIWVGPYQTDVNIEILNHFDYLGFIPGTRIINVDLSNKDVRERYCDTNICDLENSLIVISENEGIYAGYLIAGSLGTFLDTIGSEDVRSNLTYRSEINDIPYNFNFVKFGLNNQTSNQIDFFTPALIERLYIAISNPTFAYLFFVLGFALIGLELFAMGPGLMAFIGGLLILLSSMTFEELGVNYLGIVLFLISFLIYIRVLSRGYFSFMGLTALMLQYVSSLVMFSDSTLWKTSQHAVSVNKFSLASVSIGLALFYFVAIPTVIRSRLTTDNSSVTSLASYEAEYIRKIDSQYGLFRVNSIEIKIQHLTRKRLVKGSSYKVIEQDGSLFIQ